MKERERLRVVFLSEGHFREGVGGWSGEFAFAVIVQDSLEISSRAGGLVEIPIALAQRKIGVRATRCAGIIVEIFLIFRNCEIVEFSGEKCVGVLDLSLFRLFAFGGRRLLRPFIRRQRALNLRLRN